MEEQIGRRLETLAPDEPYPALTGFKARTLPTLFLERCQRTPQNVAFLAKDGGIYQAHAWKEYLEHVRNFCSGWMYADLATQAAGSISCGIYPGWDGGVVIEAIFKEIG